MKIGIPKERAAGERRVALVPAAVPALVKAGLEVAVETGAGLAAGIDDGEFRDKGATVAPRPDVIAADVLLQVRSCGADPTGWDAELAALRAGQTVIAFCEPLSEFAPLVAAAERGVSVFSMELMPRITRAQSMDALSSMATIAGYHAVLLGAQHLPRLFPMLMTAAGTLTAAKVLVIGVGVAGLQALSTARRLGAVTEGYDVRPAVKDQVLSVGAKFVDLGLDTAAAEGAGGYAKEQSEDFLRRQREALAQVVARHDVVITTAAVPGKKAPVIVTADMVRGMRRGSVIVDLAAERGGNCACTQPGADVDVNGVQVLGPLNLAARAPFHASQMYAKNITTFLAHLVKNGAFAWDLTDEITRETLVTHQGQVCHARVRELMGIAE